jgi:outer membrane assembly lipoprotein YfiO
MSRPYLKKRGNRKVRTPDVPAALPSHRAALTIRPRMDCKKTAIVAGIAMLLAAQGASAAASAAAPKTWEYDIKAKSWPLVPQSQPATPTSGRAGVPQNDVLDRADRALARRRPNDARALLVPWLKDHPQAADRDRGVFLLAETYIQKGDRIRAFYHLDEVLDNYPESTFYYPALEKQFAIANVYLAGKKDRLFWMPVLGRRDEAVEMLYRIQERSPGSPTAERALLRTADHYYDTAQYDLANDAYAAYLRSYPRTPLAESGRVKLRQAFSSLAQFRGLDFDATPLVDARAALGDVIAQHPDLSKEENLPAVIDRIDATLSGKLFRTADFYRRTRQPQAAAHLYRSIVAQYPNTPTAARAEQAMAKLPAAARNAPVGAAAGGAVEPGRISVPGPDVQ